MNDAIRQAAHAAAARLVPEYGQRLPADVEAALHSAYSAPRRDQYLDPISLGGLIVSVATLAWTIYQDHKKKHNDPPAASVIIRTIRIEIDDNGVPGELGTEQRDRIIQTVVEETTHAINDETARPGDR
ncbi:hypothetical protein F8568_020435 [Actinomadura sp. LD22]|uniref:Uncharacterized protein n=1 Tax=Actinomadura physcomitrii TaxID=2650748 RepID=A0A6I4MCP5_9ACTN|nr:hypothetical protein [Actinomadura physcomitrii]MWA02700.1 hypothetical protein [Actinomadura physcomitrii]